MAQGSLRTIAFGYKDMSMQDYKEAIGEEVHHTQSPLHVQKMSSVRLNETQSPNPRSPSKKPNLTSSAAIEEEFDSEDSDEDVKGDGSPLRKSNSSSIGLRLD